MLKETIAIHDNYQFEIKLSLQFANDGRQSTHNVETYLFFPNSLCINQKTLSRESFFGQMKNYIRLRVPWVSLEDMDKPARPLARLERFFEQHTTDASPSQEEFEDHVKILCLTTKRALRSLSLKAAASPVELATNVAKGYLVRCENILERYRNLSASIRTAGLDASPAFAYGDEFLSIVATYYAFRIVDRMQNFPDHVPCAQTTSALVQFIHKELEYRVNVLNAVVPRTNCDNELFVFRWSMLKKYMSSALFLEIRERHDSQYWQQAIYCFAAGAAMIFATAIAFIWQGHYGTLSAPLFMALIVSYIFKDRMKDLLKASMSSWLRRILSDRKLAIYRNFTSPAGICKESFDFVAEKSLPSEVAALRDKVHMVDVSNAFRSETVLRYRKDITIFSKADVLSARGFSDGMLDITRIGVHEFLRYMDEPEEPLYALEGGECCRVSGSKVYHINMIRIQHNPEGTRCRRYRIVLDRNGIKRIERVR